MKSGSKGTVSVAPLCFSGYPRDRAKRRLRFIREFCLVPRGHNAGKRFNIRAFQREIVMGAFAAGVRTALVSMPRANGKTMLAAALAIADLFVGPASAEVLVVASDARQAAIVLKYAKRIVELNPVLAERVQVYSDHLYLPENDATLMPLPAEPGALHGHDPSLLIVDELHVVTEAVWEAITSMAGKRPESLCLAISTPAASADSVMWRLVCHGREGSDPAFYFREYTAPPNCAVDDRDAWRIANPALSCEDPFLAEDGIEAVRKTVREPVFRQLRLGQWVTGVDSWLPFGAWDACFEERSIRGPITAGFDGSASGDSTALVGCTMDGHLFLIGLWENPGDPDWRVPREAVSDAVDVMFDRYEVLSLACDPWGWRSEIEQWGKRHGEKRVVEYNTGFVGRMAPATDRLYQAVVDQTVTHDGDPRLAAHMAHCVARPTPQGDVITKDKRGSPRKVDAAIAAIVAFDRRAFHMNNPRRRRRAASF
ncbi:MAG: terminase large subunit [Mycobacterium sp.]|nr:terminase large subunit [Mycobacterium sp.]